MLKCLEKKKDSFNIHVLPLTRPVNRIDQYDKDNIDIVDNDNIIIKSKNSNQHNTKWVIIYWIGFELKWKVRDLRLFLNSSGV